VVDVRTLEEGGQRADEIADALVAWLGEARRSLDLALYDVRLPGPVGDRVAAALRAAMDRGVQVRLAYNDDTPGPEPRPFEPPPPSTEPYVLQSVGAELKAIPGWRDLMHHKYAVRDGAAVWTGSTNWTLDSWTRQENVLATVASAPLAAAFARDFEQLWRTGTVGSSGSFDDAAEDGVRAWFCPGRGRELSHRVAALVGTARERVRIATPLVTAGPILGALGEVIADGRLDIAGVCDASQVGQVFRQWAQNPRSRWKAPLLARALPIFTGKRSTPYAPGTVHDFMHAKVTVADDIVLLGSFNLSRAGESNAENVLEIHDAALADRLAAWIDGLRERYPEPVHAPPETTGQRAERNLGRGSKAAAPSSGQPVDR
jgi:phosphatidylserine/phosphatidylglycerophosphate/cardiolipin synthase-like enzyme